MECSGNEWSGEVMRAKARVVYTTDATENIPFSALVNLHPYFGQKLGHAGIRACSKKECSPARLDSVNLYKKIGTESAAFRGPLASASFPTLN